MIVKKHFCGGLQNASGEETEEISKRKRSSISCYGEIGERGILNGEGIEEQSKGENGWDI